MSPPPGRCPRDCAAARRSSLREGLVLCGLPLAEAVMEAIDGECAFVGAAEEGSSVGAGAAGGHP